MSNMKTLVLCSLMACGGAYFINTGPEARVSAAQLWSSATGRTAAPATEADTVAASAVSADSASRQRPRTTRPKSASVVSIPRRNGQFFAQGRVNRGSLEFLVDTGASSVALTYEDARKAGLDLRRLQFSTPVNTANGQTYAARVMLEDVWVGGIRVRDVEGLVVKDGLHISLLGMSFLGELQKVEATPEQLVLRL